MELENINFYTLISSRDCY